MKKLILLHGALGHSDMFAPYEEWLSAHFEVHKILFEGHGDSPMPAGAPSIAYYTQQLHQYIQQQQLEQVHVFGYSMGGYIALWYSLQHPGVIQSLITLGTKLNWTEEGALKESRLLIPETLKVKVPAYAAQLAGMHGSDKWAQLVEGTAQLMLDLGKSPLLPEAVLQTIAIPVQLMVGDKDKMTGVAETCAAASAIPQSRLAILPATPHPFEQVRPALLKSLLNDFWQLDNK